MILVHLGLQQLFFYQDLLQFMINEAKTKVITHRLRFQT